MSETRSFTLSEELGIVGSKNIVVASVDADRTDGSGIQFTREPEGILRCY